MIWGAPAWAWPAIALGVCGLGVVVWSYRHPGAESRTRATAAALKIAGLLALALCLVEPLVRRVHARPGANQLVVLVDTSRSQGVRDRGEERTRADRIAELTGADTPWALRAAQDFDVRRHAFDARLRTLSDSDELVFEGEESALARALSRIARRSEGLPVAGVMLFTDGIATDEFGGDFPWDSLPPVHPVVVGGTPARDAGVERIAVSQTNFEESPVTVRADVRAVGCEGLPVVVELHDEAGAVVDRQIAPAGDGELREVQFRAPSEPSGVHFYRVVARIGSDTAEPDEAAAENNARWVVVDRGSGPYRILYVSGRPNWEFKFLRRALDEDPELDLVGLVRIAKRQPKFTFRAGQDRRSTLWEGFDREDEEVAEQYDEPVLLRLGTTDEFELREGFPRAEEDLFPYHAVVIDDLEATFFSRDQMTLIEQFVSRRGGGFLALGGQQSFLGGGYRDTPLADLLPVYLDRTPPLRPTHGWEVDLTREGWLEPWVRLRSTEDLERDRLTAMPDFKTLNRVGGVKPGGIVLLAARDRSGASRPAFVVQRFGKGRAGAMTVADLWRWDLRREDPAKSDLGTAWRQTLRWLVSDVPRKAELDVTQDEESGAMTIRAVFRDDAFEPAHDARVVLSVKPPDGDPIELDPAPSSTEAGTWVASFVPDRAGPHRALVAATSEDGSELGRAEAGWVSEPAVEEFRRLDPDRELLRDIALRTGGALVEPGDLLDFASGLAGREVPITDQDLDPLWHRWWVFAFALACFCAEWGLRRFKGLP